MSHVCTKRHLQVERGYEAKLLQYLCLTEDQCMNRHMCEYCLEDDEHAEHLKDHIYPHKQKRIRYIEFEDTIKQMINQIEENRIADQVNLLQTLADKLIAELSSKIESLRTAKQRLSQTQSLILYLYEIKISEDLSNINSLCIYKLSTAIQMYLNIGDMPQDSGKLQTCISSLEEALETMTTMSLNLNQIQDHQIDREYLVKNPYSSSMPLHDRMKFEEEQSQRNAESQEEFRPIRSYKKKKVRATVRTRSQAPVPSSQAPGDLDKLAKIFEYLYEHIRLNCNQQVISMFNLEKLNAWPDIGMLYVDVDIKPPTKMDKFRYYGQFIGRQNRHGLGMQIQKDTYRLGIWQNNYFVWGQTVSLVDFNIHSQKHQLYTLMIGSVKDGYYSNQVRFFREDGEGYQFRIFRFNGIMKHGKFQEGLYTGYYIGMQGYRIQYSYQGTFNNHEQFNQGVFDSEEFKFEGQFRSNEFDKGIFTDKSTNEVSEVRFIHQKQGESKYADNSLQLMCIIRYLGRFRYGRPKGKMIALESQAPSIGSPKDTISKKTVAEKDFDHPTPSKRVHTED